MADVEAKDVLYIGDHETNDIWAPNQVGIDAVRIIRYPYHTGDGYSFPAWAVSPAASYDLVRKDLRRDEVIHYGWSEEKRNHQKAALFVSDQYIFLCYVFIIFRT